MRESPNIVLLGGSFNPVHMGHVFAACYLAHLGKFDGVMVMPVFKHPDNKQLADYHHRYEMCRMAMSWIPKVTVSDFEYHLLMSNMERNYGNVSPNYTRDTVMELKQLHPTWKIFFAVGSDNQKFENWVGGMDLLQEATPVIIGRAGNPDSGGLSVLPEISSTDIRRSLVTTRILADAFLPEGVLDYIDSNKLYGVK